MCHARRAFKLFVGGRRQDGFPGFLRGAFRRERIRRFVGTSLWGMKLYSLGGGYIAAHAGDLQRSLAGFVVYRYYQAGDKSSSIEVKVPGLPPYP